jgi:hypothetical protein
MRRTFSIDKYETVFDFEDQWGRQEKDNQSKPDTTSNISPLKRIANRELPCPRRECPNQERSCNYLIRSS